MNCMNDSPPVRRADSAAKRALSGAMDRDFMVRTARVPLPHPESVILHRRETGRYGLALGRKLQVASQ